MSFDHHQHWKLRNEIGSKFCKKCKLYHPIEFKYKFCNTCNICVPVDFYKHCDTCNKCIQTWNICIKVQGTYARYWKPTDVEICCSKCAQHHHKNFNCDELKPCIICKKISCELLIKCNNCQKQHHIRECLKYDANIKPCKVCNDPSGEHDSGHFTPCLNCKICIPTYHSSSFPKCTKCGIISYIGYIALFDDDPTYIWIKWPKDTDSIATLYSIFD